MGPLVPEHGAGPNITPTYRLSQPIQVTHAQDFPSPCGSFGPLRHVHSFLAAAAEAEERAVWGVAPPDGLGDSAPGRDNLLWYSAAV
jgi:hypothetical protein